MYIVDRRRRSSSSSTMMPPARARPVIDRSSCCWPGNQAAIDRSLLHRRATDGVWLKTPCLLAPLCALLRIGAFTSDPLISSFFFSGDRRPASSAGADTDADTVMPLSRFWAIGWPPLVASFPDSRALTRLMTLFPRAPPISPLL